MRQFLLAVVVPVSCHDHGELLALFYGVCSGIVRADGEKSTESKGVADGHMATPVGPGK